MALAGHGFLARVLVLASAEVNATCNAQANQGHKPLEDSQEEHRQREQERVGLGTWAWARAE
eukprot:14610414-Alexandrium_andersonii.AAC.1